jgi:hypothetical protein
MSIVCAQVKNLESSLRASYTKQIQCNVACDFMTSHFLLSAAKATIVWTWNKFCLNRISWVSVKVSKAQLIASSLKLWIYNVFQHARKIPCKRGSGGVRERLKRC